MSVVRPQATAVAITRAFLGPGCWRAQLTPSLRFDCCSAVGVANGAIGLHHTCVVAAALPFGMKDGAPRRGLLRPEHRPEDHQGVEAQRDARRGRHALGDREAAPSVEGDRLARQRIAPAAPGLRRPDLAVQRADPLRGFDAVRRARCHGSTRSGRSAAPRPAASRGAEPRRCRRRASAGCDGRAGRDTLVRELLHLVVGDAPVAPVADTRDPPAPDQHHQRRPRGQRRRAGLRRTPLAHAATARASDLLLEAHGAHHAGRRGTCFAINAPRRHE
jgi:hypothetical protein